MAWGQNHSFLRESESNLFPTAHNEGENYSIIWLLSLLDSKCVVLSGVLLFTISPFGFPDSRIIICSTILE